MARYHREFLVPYLQDLYSLYIAENKVQKAINAKELQIERYCKEPYVPEPKEPKYAEDSIGCIGLLSLGWIVAAGFFLVLGILPSFVVVLFIMGMMLFIPLFIYDLKSASDGRKYNRAVEDRYNRDMKQWKEDKEIAQKEHERNLEVIPYLQSEVDELTSEQRTIQIMRRNAYNANVIPGHYRNFYTIVYLYDWFSTSGADDLDHALSMYVLEEIKSRLDRIIEQQSDMILNQRIMMAKQQESIDQQNHHSQMMRRKLNQIQATEDERLRYEKMIECNTAATAYFAAANYFKS